MGLVSSNAKLSQVLRALDGALASTRAAVLAAHPELLALHPGPLKLGAAGWMGDELLMHIAGLAAAVERYSLALEAERAQRQGPERAA
jgi:hypothetical protein